MNNSELIFRAADIMDARGKSENYHIEPGPEGGGGDVWTGPCCIKGALYLALNKNEYRPRSVDPTMMLGFNPAALQVIADLSWSNFRTSFHAYNREQNKETVIAFMRSVAFMERMKESRLLPVVVKEVCHVE